MLTHVRKRKNESNYNSCFQKVCKITCYVESDVKVIYILNSMHAATCITKEIYLKNYFLRNFEEFYEDLIKISIKIVTESKIDLIQEKFSLEKIEEVLYKEEKKGKNQRKVINCESIDTLTSEVKESDFTCQVPSSSDGKLCEKKV
jgi:hypothetical protein